MNQLAQKPRSNDNGPLLLILPRKRDDMATSHFVLAIMAFTGTMTHVVSGTFPHSANLTLSLAIGVLLGAPVGAYLSNRIHGDWIIRGLALALVVVGFRILIMSM